MNKIEEALLKIFTKYRIVFWYDENEELREQFDKMELAGIEKIIVENNPFYIKYLTNREKPNEWIEDFSTLGLDAQDREKLQEAARTQTPQQVEKLQKDLVANIAQVGIID